MREVKEVKEVKAMIKTIGQNITAPPNLIT